jgi:ABC-type multidrug transport system ATPase subunit
MIDILEVDSVILEYGTKKVLQDVYLKCETGKITGLLGRNGSGKTCLMKIIYGKLSANNSSVRFNGEALLNTSRPSENIMYLPQFNFIPKFLTLKRIFKDFKLDFSEFINDFPEFSKYYKSKFIKLSGGEQRIVEIYLIIASNTKFCLLDEPFSHVMPVHIDSIKKLIVREKINKGFLITDHLYKYITDICDNLYVINDGKTYLTNSLQDIETLGYAKIKN